MQINVNEYIKEIEDSDKNEIVDILKGKRAYRLANTIFDLNDIDRETINSSILIIFKYTPRIHQQLIIKYIIGDSIIGTRFDKKHIPKFMQKYF